MMKTDAEYAKELNEAIWGDPEADHVRAEEILLDVLLNLGYVELVKAFDEASADFWYA